MARNGDTRRDDDTGTHIITKTRPKTKRPSLYKVLLLNDDYTPMDFVVYVLERFFNKPPEEATRIIIGRVGNCQGQASSPKSRF
jgi:ATP-dependent Clp protease adaptor protein ClpS